MNKIRMIAMAPAPGRVSARQMQIDEIEPLEEK